MELNPAQLAELRFLKQELRRREENVEEKEGTQNLWLARNELRKFQDNLRQKGYKLWQKTSSQYGSILSDQATLDITTKKQRF